MKTVTRAGGLCCGLTAMLMAGSFLFAQETKKSETKAEAKAETKAAKKADGRLPANYRQLNLSDEQRKKILGIRVAHAIKIAEVAAQLKTLKDKETAEIEAILTPEQVKELAELRAASKKKSAASRAKDADKDTDAEKKPEEDKAKPEAEKKPAEKK